MKPGSFVLYEPSSVEQAVVMLADVAEHDGRIIAGGQTLVPAMAMRFAQPAYLIDINSIAALKRLVIERDQLVIGACVRHAAFHEPVTDGPLGHLLSTVVRHIAHLPIRNRGTFCGSIANADPASEWCLVSVALDATLVAQSVSGIREISASSFFLGFMTTALNPDELLVSANLPLLETDTRFGFHEVSRRAGDFAQAMALAVFRLDGPTLRNVRIALGGVETVPKRLAAVEELLEGQAFDSVLLERAAQIASETVEPVDTTDEDIRYRRRLVRTVVIRAVKTALANTASE
jgi:aerobic carbon-monoxide dehydrogenase medium subunit